MCLPGMNAQGASPGSSGAGVPPAIPLADAKADALKGDKATMERMGERVGAVKRQEYWDAMAERKTKEKVLNTALDEFEKKKRKELGL